MAAGGIRKATPGIMGPWPLKVHIDEARWCVVVGSPFPGCAQAAKGTGVHWLKGDVSWVDASESKRHSFILANGYNECNETRNGVDCRNSR